MSSLTYGQLRDALEAALSDTVIDPDSDSYQYVYVVDFSDATVVYCFQGEYFSDSYVDDGLGNIKIAGDPVPVRPLTTYLPIEQQENARAEMERRGFVGSGGPAIRPESLAPAARIKDEPLTYHRHARHSYFRDSILMDLGRAPSGAVERLERHGQEMRVVLAERERRAWQAIHAGGVEYRVEPNRTDGQGGYFSPPLWVNELFATANRPGRVLADLMPCFDLPPGVSQVNLPIISTGTVVDPQADGAPVPSQAITDSSGSSWVTTLSGKADVALQLLELSPVGAALDWALFQDLCEAYDDDLETQLLSGVSNGPPATSLGGVTNVSGINSVTYTSGSPTGAGLWPFLGQAAAQIGDNRKRPPECWLMRTARWAWLEGSEDTATRPFGLPSPFFLGSDDETPDPVSGLYGWPVFCDDAVSATIGGTQDQIILLRPTDLCLFEGMPQTAIDREPGSGNLSVRLRLRNYVAAITGRRPAGISVVGGTGLAVQSGW